MPNGPQTCHEVANSDRTSRKDSNASATAGEDNNHEPSGIEKQLGRSTPPPPKKKGDIPFVFSAEDKWTAVKKKQKDKGMKQTLILQSIYI